MSFNGNNNGNSTFLHEFSSSNANNSLASFNGSGRENGGPKSPKLSSTALAEMKEKVMRGSTSHSTGLNNLSSGNINNKLVNSKTMILPSSSTSIQSAHKSNQREIMNLTQYPNWVNDRIFLNWDFFSNPDKFESDNEVNKLPMSQQENMIIEDLLNCMVGIEGKFIKTPSLIDEHAERTFHINRSLDQAMRELAIRIVPVCANYSLIMRFVQEKSHFKWGLVNHALVSAIREILKNHHISVCQFEALHRSGNLSLQKLWYYVNPIMGFMDILALIIRIINKGDCCGSSVINLLFEKVLSHSGDPKLQELIFYLAKTSSDPYLTMLEDWIYKGQICDPYREFMIYEDKEITKDKLKDEFNEKFWDKKYIANRANTPKFLEALSDKILLTGKYINAIHETNRDQLYKHQQQQQTTERSEKIYTKLKFPNVDEIVFTTKEENYKIIVDNAYNYASKVLLDMLLKDHKLMDRLRSLKHYFLLDQADFMVHFMDISEDELKKDAKDIKPSRLESLLDLSLRITSANSDPYKEDLRVKLSFHDLKTMIMRIQNPASKTTTTTVATNDFNLNQNEESKLTGFTSFTLDYVVKWPLSLIINKKTLIKYQILFRHIFLIKCIERQLCNIWLCTKTGESCIGRSHKYYASTCALKQRMLNFVQNLLNYMTFEVFESSWNIFEQSINQVENIDDLILNLTTFLDSCLRDCLITGDSFRTIEIIMSTCAMFSNTVNQITERSRLKEEEAKIDFKIDYKTAKERRNMALEEINEELNEQIKVTNFAKTVHNFDMGFTAALLDLLAKTINEMGNGLGEAKIGSVLYRYSISYIIYCFFFVIIINEFFQNRLDFNDYYREQLEKLKLNQQLLSVTHDNSNDSTIV
jgi:gamma-tubulin complex component 2